ncbi:hypothetical protein [Wolbachia endosymbiont (group A) of Agelastica alni]|uniref:hypothetical protein n=1 Tax=Wolbachia endosymbiont (group A) of Agelastica alni TaxID=3066130 RepID=UPI00333FBA01
MVVDTVGLIIAADVHSASVQDRDGALNLFTQAKYKAPTLRKFFADQGYIAKPLFIGNGIRLPRKLLMLQDSRLFLSFIFFAYSSIIKLFY